MFQKGDYAGAIRAYRQLLKSNPRQADLLHRLAIAQAQVGQLDAAARDLEKAIKLRPSAANYLADLGQLLSGAMRYEEAERAYDRALEADPSFTFVYGAKAELFLLTGEFEKGIEAVREGLRLAPDDVRVALAYARLAPRMGAEREALEALGRHLASGALQGEAKINALYRLGDLHDKVGAFDDAFAAYREANDLFPGQFAPEQHAAAVSRMINAWSTDRMATLPRSGQDAATPVFIVGMPRSGTSLVEQILACHPEVHGASELDDIPRIVAALGGGPQPKPMLDDPSPLTKAALDKHARAYLSTLYKVGGKAARVTDKLPTNFLHLGLIDRMLPGARVIHCVRDPRDTCLSCYFQHFRGAWPWAYRLGWLGAYYREYERLMAHWKEVVDVPVLEVRYENLVGDQEAWSRRLVEFAGLDWADECLAPHESKRVTATLSNEQVRRPMYRSSMERWRNYESHLGPLVAVLGGKAS